MQNLIELTRFLVTLEEKDLTAGKMIVTKDTTSGVISMPYVDYCETANEFIKTAYEHGWVLEGFDWLSWVQSEEALSLRDDKEALNGASAKQLAQLLTAIIRQDRFNEGVLLKAFDTGLVLRIVRRAAAILEAEDKP